MGYRYLNVRINSVNDASISCKNFLNFGPITLELTELICEPLVRHGQKTGAFSRISPDILYQFSQSFHRMKALWVHRAGDGSVPNFPICQGTLPWQTSNVAIMKAD